MIKGMIPRKMAPKGLKKRNLHDNMTTAGFAAAQIKRSTDEICI